MVVLAAAIEPEIRPCPLATMLTASMDTNDFLTEAHRKAASRRVPDGGRIPLGSMPGPEGYSGNGRTGLAPQPPRLSACFPRIS